MNLIRIGMALLVSGFVLFITQSILVTSTAQGESYVALQSGYAFPQSLTNCKVTQDGFAFSPTSVSVPGCSSRT